MINNLHELNDKVNDFVNYVVKTACEKTTSGQYYVSVDDACTASGMSYEDFLQYKELILSELYQREELLELDFSDTSMEFDVNCGLNYCPHYQWCDGDEAIFECSFDEWLEKPAIPVAQPLSMSRMAEIGLAAVIHLWNSESPEYYQETFVEKLGFTADDAATFGLREVLGLEEGADVKDSVVGTITYHDNNEVVKYTDPDAFVRAYQSALDSMGLNGCTAKVVADNLELKYAIDKIIIGEIGEEIEPFDVWKAKREKSSKEETDRLEAVDCSLNDLQVGKWRVHIVPPGGTVLGGINESQQTLVEFWDMSSDKTAFPDGQFVSRYYLENLLEYNLPHPRVNFGLILVGDVPGWMVSGDEMKQINDWLGKRELLPGEHYYEYFGDVDVPTWMIERRFGPVGYVPKMAGELLLGEVLTPLPFVHNLSIEHIGEYNKGHGYSVSFRCQNERRNLIVKGLHNVLASLNYEFDTVVEHVVPVEKPSLDAVINTCEKVSKKADVVDINKYRKER